MSLLPQHKKSAAEIAQLRESLGIPALPTEDAPAAAAEPQFMAPPPAPSPHTPPPGPKPVHSLKRSERLPVLLPEPLQPAAAAAPVPTDLTDGGTQEPPVQVLKTVRSLRKSEQGPLSPPTPAESAAESNLPFHRHSDKELQAIRRREALAMLTPVPNPRLAAAHPGLLVPGYLGALVGAASIYFYQQPLLVSAPCVTVSLLVATFIALKKPISRHHAAFIAVICLFVIVFGALYYFPQLRNAT